MLVILGYTKLRERILKMDRVIMQAMFSSHAYVELVSSPPYMLVDSFHNFVSVIYNRHSQLANF